MRRAWMLMTVAAFAGCASSDPDALPDDPMRVLKTKMVAPVPDAGMAERSGQSLDHLGQGHAVFTAKCIECHEPRVAVKTSDPSWRPTMHGMSGNAGIDAADEQALVDYLRAAAEE